jgi:hypothetical protein
MYDLFDAASRREILDRLDRLTPDSPRQWGKMTPAQMLAHCSNALEVANGDHPKKQILVGRLFGPLVRKKFLGEAPFPHNSPTDPTFVISDDRDFAKEKARLQSLAARFVELGPDHAAACTHTFFGRMTGTEWGVMMGKHLDHHLRQFGV